MHSLMIHQAASVFALSSRVRWLFVECFPWTGSCFINQKPLTPLLHRALDAPMTQQVEHLDPRPSRKEAELG